MVVRSIAIAITWLAFGASVAGCYPRFCDSRLDCRVDEACLEGKCVEAECSATMECGGGACVDRLCAPCRMTLDCDGALVCDGTGACVEPECTTHAECPTDSEGACRDGFCRPCRRATDCGTERACDAGVCVEPECVTNAECGATEVCNDGLCGQCRIDGDCDSMACHHGTCVERECTRSPDCADGRVCDAALCLPCGETVFCDDQLACIEGACAPCTTHEDCGVGRVCGGARCFNPCEADRDCDDREALGCRTREGGRTCMTDSLCGGHSGSPWSGGEICDACGGASGGCPSGICDAELRCLCRDSSECPPSLTCRGGACVGCEFDADCGCDRYCDAQECHDRCAADTDCPSGTRCHPEDGRCVWCLNDADCSGDDRCYEDGCVGPCSDGLGGGCAPFVDCSVNNRCGFCGGCTLGPARMPVPSCG